MLKFKIFYWFFCCKFYIKNLEQNVFYSKNNKLHSKWVWWTKKVQVITKA